MVNSLNDNHQLLVKHKSEDDFIEYILSTWQWKMYNGLINWQRTLKLFD